MNKLSRYEHLREIRLDRGGKSVEFRLETASPELPPAGEQFCKDIAATLAMYTGRLKPFPAGIRVRFDDLAAEKTPEAEGPAPDGEIAAGAAAEAAASAPPLMEKVLPRYRLEDFVCGPEFRRVLTDVLFYARHYPEIRAAMGAKSVTRSFLVNFFGESGTGKTMAAEAFAAELGVDLYVMNFANVESSLLGKTPKNIARAFREIDPATAIVMLDEADAFVSRRIADLRQGAEYALNAARGQIIGEIDRFDGMVILATNLFGTYDNAILRRIKFNLYFELPDVDAIEKMYRSWLGAAPMTPMDPKQAASGAASGLPALDFRQLAESSAGLSGGDVYNVSEIIVMKALQARLGEAAPSFPMDSNPTPAGGAGIQTAGVDAAEINRIVTYYRSKTRPGGSIRLAGDSYGHTQE